MCVCVPTFMKLIRAALLCHLDNAAPCLDHLVTWKLSLQTVQLTCSQAFTALENNTKFRVKSLEDYTFIRSSTPDAVEMLRPQVLCQCCQLFWGLNQPQDNSQRTPRYALQITSRSFSSSSYSSSSSNSSLLIAWAFRGQNHSSSAVKIPYNSQKRHW